MASQRRSKTKPSKKFTGALAHPIKIKTYRSTLVGLSEEEACQKNAEAVSDALNQLGNKFDLLFQHFKITRSGNDAEDYKSLAWALAQAFVPGFQLVADSRSRGRPANDPLEYIRLLTDLEILKRGKRQTGSAASETALLKELVSNSRFEGRWGRYKGRVRTLANKLAQARDQSINPMWTFWALPGAHGTLARNRLIEMFSVTKNGL